MLENEWLIPANSSTYNHAEAFDNLDVITWGLKTKNVVGDTVYIYASAPDSRIAYKCVVEKINVPLNECLGEEYWVGLSKQDPTRNLINIRLIAKYPNDYRLSLQHLVNNSFIKVAPQGPRRIDQNLSTFLKGIQI